MPVTVRVSERNGKLEVDIRTRGRDGKPIRERRNAPSEITSKSGARRWGEERAAFLREHGREEPKAEVPTLTVFVERWMRDFAKANGNKPSTIDTKERINRKHLVPVLGKLPLDAIGDAEAQKVKLHLLEAGAGSAKTQRDVLSQLGTILDSAVRWRLIDRAPEFDLPKLVEPEAEFYDFDVWEQLVAGAEKAGPMPYVMVLLAGEAGLRRGELVAFEQVDAGPQEITVRWNEWKGKVGTPKGGKIRRIPMTERLRQAIARVRHLRGKRLLWQPNGKPVKVPTLQSWLEMTCRRAGLPESRDVHKLRHTFCSHLAMRGATAKAIQELAGHADIKTTMRYMHLSPAHKADAIKLLEQRGGGAGGEQKSEPGPV